MLKFWRVEHLKEEILKSSCKLAGAADLVDQSEFVRLQEMQHNLVDPFFPTTPVFSFSSLPSNNRQFTKPVQAPFERVLWCQLLPSSLVFRELSFPCSKKWKELLQRWLQPNSQLKQNMVGHSVTSTPSVQFQLDPLLLFELDLA